MEELLHYTWRHKLLPAGELSTTDGRRVEVIDPGLHNSNAGPDFFNAKVKLDGTLWVGNVELHVKSSDWYVHGHERDPQYDNVVLHVASVIDTDVRTAAGGTPPQLQLSVPPSVETNYRELLAADRYPPCYKVIPTLQRLTVRAWMSALQTERLERKTRDIERRVKECDGSWEAAYFVTLARNYGFGINSEAFEEWGRAVPLAAVAKHRDDLFQVEAIFLGQAGLLDETAISERLRPQAVADSYYQRLRSEYAYLAHKFGLQPMNARLWRFLRLHPQNFPQIRISQLAWLYHQRRASLSELVECQTVKEAEELLRTHATDYWQTHYAFGSESERNAKTLSKGSLNLLLINTVVPVLFAYGRHKGDERLCDRAFEFLETLKPEANSVVRMWKEVGLPVECAGDSQALLQLKREYCERRDCLRCRFGFEYLKRNRI